MEYLPILYIILAIGGSLIKLINKNKEKTKEQSIFPELNNQPKGFSQPASLARKKSSVSLDPYSLKGDLFDDFDPYQDVVVDQEELFVTENKQEKIDDEIPEIMETTNSEYPKKSDLISVVERFPEEDYYDRVINRKNFHLNLRTENLIQGIILSEVLGPPRAKRRYTPITNQNR